MSALNVQLRSAGPIRLDATFDCQPGEMVALLGPSGSGKTSLLRAISGLLPHAGVLGSVQFGDKYWFNSQKKINLPPQARRVGLVFQSYALFPHMTAIENIAVSAYSTGLHARFESQLSPFIHDLMARMGLEGSANRLPNQLSGGQQQRVALARALVRLQTDPGNINTAGNPQGVLLLDEPFSAVDAPTRQSLYRELASLRQHVSTPMVLVTHDLLEARRLADRVVVLDGGTTLQTGVPSKIFGQPRNARVAQLVGIQNLFKGRFHKAEPGWAQLRWTPEGLALEQCNFMLHTVDKGRIDDGAEVHWVLAGDSIELQPWVTETPIGSAPQTNVLDCQVQEILALGETSLCTLRPLDQGADQVTLTVATSQLRSLGARVGGWLKMHIATQGIHIMPLKQQ